MKLVFFCTVFLFASFSQAGINHHLLLKQDSEISVQPEIFIYRQIDKRTLKAYVFQPANTGKDHSAILLFHGGAWKLGDQ